MVFPDGMSTAVKVPGYTVTGVAGVGGSGTILRGRDAAGTEVALRVVPEAPAGLVRRAGVAGGVQHPGVAGVLDLVELPGDGLAVVSQFVPGPTLATLRAARRGLSSAECAQVAAELLTVLAALHAEGIVHGDVSPANVIVTPVGEETGRLVLVDLVGGAGPVRGTRGFCAPELEQGAPASAVADVYSAAQVSLAAAEPAVRQEVAELLGPMLSSDPQLRPSAHHGLQLLDGVARVGVGLAPAEVLASATLREHAARELTTRARIRRTRVRRRHRARRRWWWRAGGAVGAAAVVVAALLLGLERPAGERLPVGTVPAAGSAGPGESGAPVEPGESQDSGAADQVAAAVRDLLTARDDALSGGDGEALAALTVPESPLAAADTALLAELTDAGVQLHGYATRVEGLQVMAAGAQRAEVRLRVQQTAHQRTGADGVLTQVPAQPVQCLELTLERAPAAGTWRAATAQPC